MSIKIKELPELERPYEKLEMYGEKTLSNAELLAIIIKTGTKEETSVQLAQRLLSLNKTTKEDLNYLQTLSIEELMEVKGIGKVKAIQLKAVGEISARMFSKTKYKKMPINEPKDLAQILIGNVKSETNEKVKIAILNSRNELLKIQDIASGGVDFVNVEVKEILTEPIKMKAPKYILVHNHPSNNLEPSKDDLHLTDVTNEMLKVFNIQLQDHIIVTEKDFISMNKIQKIGKERNIKSINTLQKGMLIEENERLKQKINELQKEIGKNNSLQVISAEYVGNYNDTTVYNVELSLNGKKEYATLEKKYNDIDASYKWEVFSNLALKDEEMDYIIQVVSKNPPTMSIDAPPTIYESLSVDEIEMEG